MGQGEVAIMVSTEARDSVQTLLCLAANVFDAYTTAFFLRQGGEGQTFTLRGWFSLGDAVNPDATLEQDGSGTLAGWITQSGRSLVVNDYDRARSALGYYLPGQEPELRAFMGCPVGQRQGVLCVDTRRGAAFSEREQKSLTQFATLLADQVNAYHQAAHSRHLADYYRSLGHLVLLREGAARWAPYLASFLAQLVQGAGMDHAYLAVANADGLTYTVEGAHPNGLLPATHEPQPMGVGLVGWVFRTHQPLYSADPQRQAGPLFGPQMETQPYRRMACLPLVFSGRTRAVLALCGLRPGIVDEEMKGYLRLSGSNLALFLENLMLRNRLAGG